MKLSNTTHYHRGCYNMWGISDFHIQKIYVLAFHTNFPIRWWIHNLPCCYMKQYLLDYQILVWLSDWKNLTFLY